MSLCRPLAGAQTLNTQPPNITLNGPATVTVLQGQPYDFCTPSNTLSDVCDRGAIATDTVDGRLDNTIRFCGFPTYQVGVIPPLTTPSLLTTKHQPPNPN